MKDHVKNTTTISVSDLFNNDDDGIEKNMYSVITY